MSSFVVDASAVLALLRREPGWEELAALHENGRFVVSAVNLSEVVAKLAEKGLSRQEISEVVAGLDLAVAPFDATLAFDAGLLRPATRPLGLSLGDRACLATALASSEPVLTADQAWAKLDLGLDIRLVR